MSEEGNFPFKDNSGTAKKDLDRGFLVDEPVEETPEFGLLAPNTEGPLANGGFLGRAKGWER